MKANHQIEARPKVGTMGEQYRVLRNGKAGPWRDSKPDAWRGYKLMRYQQETGGDGK